ncbi:MAG: sortase, partial [Chloroflexota bacterium]
VAVVAAAAVTSGTPRGPHALPEAAPVGLVLAESGTNEAGTEALVADLPADRVPPPAVVEPLTAPIIEPVETGAAPAAPAVPSPPARASMTERAPKATTSTPAAPANRGSSSPSAAHTGRNHVWIPNLGISRSVSLFPCERTRPPDNLVYRWGCAGANNVYLMGHASSVFKPLHDAYTAGRLKVGVKAWYADSNGRVRVYTVRWWKVTAPDANVGWAYAALGAPSMTLQTCVGSDSAHRLVVRLVEVGG